MDSARVIETAAIAADFFAYAREHGFALFPCAAGTKVPALKWSRDSSHDPAQWAAWYAEGKNLAINASQSGIFILDIDASKVGRDLSWRAYYDLCVSWGLLEPLPVACQSARGGWHAYVRRPEAADPGALRGTCVLVQDESGKELVGVKVRGYALAPGSFYDGTAKGEESGDYRMFASAPAPSPCPPALLEALRLPVVVTIPGVAGTCECADVAALVAFLDEQGEFDSNDTWFKGVGAIKLACGEDGIEAARQITWDEVGEDDFVKLWNRLSTEPRPRDYKIASLIWLAEQLGRKFHVRKSRDATFPPELVASAAAALPAMPSPSIAPAAQEGRVSLISGGNWQPTIAAPEYSEIEIADRFANDYAPTLRYVKARGTWLYWTGKRWCVDDTDHVANLAREHCRREAALCASTPGPGNNARTLCSDKTMNAVLRLARVDPRIASRVDAWDQDPWLLGTPDGIVDLRSGTLRDARPEDHVTKSTAVAPDGDCPTWMSFLQRATGGDVELQAYLQRMSGYALTGSTREHSLHFAHGPAGTGKGTFTHALTSILQDYHVTTAIETLTESRYDRHPTEIAALQGARLVTCSETERGRHWAESRIKQWTGGDQISARFMNQNFFNFTPTFKLLISGNYKPHMRPDTAMRRRFQLIPFVASIPERERDLTLGNKLQREWPGILAWAIAGALAWQRDGLSPPPAVLDATREYMEEEAEDVVTAWLHDCCDVVHGAEAKHGDLYRSYKVFAEQAGEKPMTSVLLSKELKRLGFEGKRTDRARLVVGVRLAAPPTFVAAALPPLPVRS